MRAPARRVRPPVRIRPLARGDRQPGGVSARALGVALAVTAVWFPGAAHAQVGVGAYGAYQSGIFEGSFGVGGRAEVALDFIAPRLAVAGTYEHFFPGCTDCSAMNTGVQVLLAPPSALYLGLGAEYARFSSAEAGGDADSGWAVNLIAGMRVPVMPVAVPFIEFRQQLWSSAINEQTFAIGLIVTPARARNAPRRPRPR